MLCCVYYIVVCVRVHVCVVCCSIYVCVVCVVYCSMCVVLCDNERRQLLLQDSLMCLPVKMSQSLGNINQLVLCHRITSSVQLVDPQTTQSEHY